MILWKNTKRTYLRRGGGKQPLHYSTTAPMYSTLSPQGREKRLFLTSYLRRWHCRYSWESPSQLWSTKFLLAVPRAPARKLVTESTSISFFRSCDSVLSPSVSLHLPHPVHGVHTIYLILRECSLAFMSLPRSPWETKTRASFAKMGQLW